MTMKTFFNTRPSLSIGVLLFAVLIVLPLAGCPDPEETFWQGPVVLNSHLAYFDEVGGQVVLLNPRKANAQPTVIALPGPEKEEDIVEGWKKILVFPDKSHIVFAAQDSNTFHVVSDAENKIALSIPDVPPIIDAASFSPDGRWLIFYVRSSYGDHTWDNRGYENVTGINKNLESFSFPNSPSILLNEHRLLVVDLEKMESFTLDLPRNDIPISGIRFSGQFRICETDTVCNDTDARQMELVVAIGRNRLWLFDPNDGTEAQVSVTPLSVSDSSSVSAVDLRASRNLVEPDDGTDNREILFITLSDSRDILALNMMWSDETEGLSFTLNKLPLSFMPYDIAPYADRGELYLLALGAGNLASIHADSARVTRFSVSNSLTRIRPLEQNEAMSHMLLTGGNTLEMVKLQDLTVFGSKNLTTAKVGFYADIIEVETGDTWRALCVDGERTHLSAIDLNALAEDDLSASVQRIDLSVADLASDVMDGMLYLSGFCHQDDPDEDAPYLCDLYGINLLDSAQAVMQAELTDVDEMFDTLPATDEQPMLFIFKDLSDTDRVVAVSADDFKITEMTGFLKNAK
jgi:hypothetical protein